jgi:protein-S-isoprenylcysteine O-methyltransferase Ste14
MQPVFAQNPLLASVLIVNALIWIVMEVTVQIRQRKRLPAGTQIHVQRQDKGSRAVLEILVRLGTGLCFVLAVLVPAAAITSARELLFWLGVLLIYAGLALRFHSIHLLGAYFTYDLAIVPEQPVIETGPYRLIRHPSYTGLLMTLLGFGFTCTNWLSLLVLMGCALIGFGYRIHREEQMLQEQLGQEYRDYMRRTKRLIPFVL